MKFSTPCCGRRIEVDPEYYGRKMECPICGGKFYIPDEDPLLKEKSLMVEGSAAQDSKALDLQTLGGISDNVNPASTAQNTPEAPPQDAELSKESMVIMGVIILVLLIFCGGAIAFLLKGDAEPESKELVAQSVAQPKEHNLVLKVQLDALRSTLETIRSEHVTSTTEGGKYEDLVKSADKLFAEGNAKFESFDDKGAILSFDESLDKYRQVLDSLQRDQSLSEENKGLSIESVALLEKLKSWEPTAGEEGENLRKLLEENSRAYAGFSLEGEKAARIQWNRQTEVLLEKVKAQRVLEEQTWKRVVKLNTDLVYKKFIEKFPYSQHSTIAHERYEDLLAKRLALEKKIAEELAEKKRLAMEAANEDIEIKYESGDSYVGQMKNKLRQGQGAYYYADGRIYNGTWENDKQSGEGVMNYPNGNSYRGNWLNGQRHGKGTYYFFSEHQYTGEWAEDKQHGLGVFTWPDGSSYKGGFAHGKFNDKAVITSAKGVKQNRRFDHGVDVTGSSIEAVVKQRKLMEKLYEAKRMSINQRRAYEYLQLHEAALLDLYEKAGSLNLPFLPQHPAQIKSYANGRLFVTIAKGFEGTLRQDYFFLKRYIAVSQKEVAGNALENNFGSASIGGAVVEASLLGVVLDNSGSMTIYLPKLRKEINKNFKDASYWEIMGCGLYQSSLSSPPETPGDTLQAIRNLIDKQAVDAVYWFSDLNDGESEGALSELSALLQKNRVKLYVKSLGNKASSELKAVVVSSGGKLL